MKNILATLAIVFGVSQFLPPLPFPDISLALISAGTSKSINMLVVFLLPLLTIISGVVALFKMKQGFISLLSIFSIYFVISVYGFAKLKVWTFLSSDIPPDIARTVIITFGNCAFFLVLIVLIYLNTFPSNKSPKGGAAAHRAA